MSLDGADCSALSRLHGELIAWDWIELNASNFGTSNAGGVAGCYRVTNAALRRCLSELLRTNPTRMSRQFTRRP